MTDISLGNCPFCNKPATWCGDEPDEDGPHECHLIICQHCDIEFEMARTNYDIDKLDGGLTELRQFCANKFNDRTELDE